ncbi:MAG: hypothetical protein K2X28_00110 [Alphaproteobacteria bacterium]|nr:hypothetical protein [Alphaproteobacteria bacterium]
MIKKYALLFFSALILLKTGVFAMTTEMEPRTRFMPVFRKIVQFQEFLSSSHCSANDLDEADLSSHSKKSAKKAHQASIDSDLKSADQFLEIGEKLLEGILTGDQFFRETLLETRLQYLLNRTERAIRSCKQEDFLIPSDPHCLNVMKRCQLKSSNAQFNEAATSRNVQRYQFLNLLCSSMFKILQRDELSEETVKLLRLSPQLWPLLKGETYDLGHPDEAGGFAVVSAYLQHPFKEGQGLRHNEKRLTSLNRAATRIERNIYCPLWEKNKLLNDEYLYRTYSSTLSLPEVELPLPYPTFLQASSHSTETEEVAFPHEPSFFETFPFEKFDNTEEEISTSTPLEEQSESIEGSSIAAADTSGSSPSSGLPTPIASSSSSMPSCSTDFIMPSGIRKFHALIPSSPYAERGLNKKDQSFIDSVFDAREFKKISYGDFETFWIKQGGKVVGSHGGSHRLLVGPNGDSLGGTYTHGRGETYTAKTIKYLRAALWYIGCRPSE